MPDVIEVLRWLPWPLLMAVGSLAVVVAMYRRRPDLYARFAFGGPEVVLLALGSVAGWAINFPLAPLGSSSFLALNLGGAVLSVFLAVLWWRRGALHAGAAAVGALLVSVVAYFVVEFDPDAGIVSEFPWFFLPALAALAFGIVACAGRWARAVPLAYVSGSVGALLGADVYNLDELQAYFSQADEAVIISVGGAGVFDMVFLSGTLAMAAAVAVAARLVPPEAMPRETPDGGYPGRPLEIRDPAETWTAFARLTDATLAERATAALARAQIAHREGDFARAARMSWLAVDAALGAGPEPARDRMEALPEALRRDVDALAAAHAAARAGPVGRDVAANALEAARYVLGAVLPGLPNRLVAA